MTAADREFCYGGRASEICLQKSFCGVRRLQALLSFTVPVIGLELQTRLIKGKSMIWSPKSGNRCRKPASEVGAVCELQISTKDCYKPQLGLCAIFLSHSSLLLTSSSFDLFVYSSIMPGAVPGPRTLYDKVLEDHIVDEKKDGTILLYIGTLEE
jgi:hypothetical protein